MDYYLPTRLLQLIYKSSRVVLSIALIAALVGCANEPDESTDIYTKDIVLDFRGRISSNNTSHVTVELYHIHEGERERLRLGSGDRLVLVVDDVAEELREEREVWTIVIGHGEVYYSYTADYAYNISNRTIWLRFDRASRISAPNTSIIFGTPPSIVTPSSDDTFSITSDDIFFEWLADTVPGGHTSVNRFYCGVNEQELFTDADQTTYTFPANPTAQLTNNCSTAGLVVHRWHNGLGALDPALYQDLDRFYTLIDRSVTVDLTE